MTNDLLFHPVFAITAIGVGVIGATTDVRSRLIPNRLTGPAIIAGLLLHLVIGGWAECGRSLAALLLCGGAFLVFHFAGGMGAGDVKFVAAEASLLSLPSVAPLLLYTAICGGVLGLTVAISRGRLRQTLVNVVILTNHHSRHGLLPHPELNVTNGQTLRLPYGLAIASGTILTVIVPLLFRGGL